MLQHWRPFCFHCKVTTFRLVCERFFFIFYFLFYTLILWYFRTFEKSTKFKRRFLLAAAHGWSTASQLPSAVPSSVSLGAVWVWLADGFTVATSRLWYECNPVPWPTDQLTIHYGAQQHYWPHWPRRREMHVIQICLILCSWNFQGRLTVYSVVWCFKESGNSFENILKSGVTSRGVGFHKSSIVFLPEHITD